MSQTTTGADSTQSPAQPAVEKSPISYLQELCTKRGVTPHYDLVANEGAVHEPLFVFKVTAGDIISTGKGSTKKKAKHSAAVAALQQMLGVSTAAAAAATSGCSGGATAANKSITGASGGNVVGGASDEGQGGNPVGELQQMTQKFWWPPPVYDFASEQGPPHACECVCIVRLFNVAERAVGKSKKLAKRNAAVRMLQLIRQGLVSPMLGPDQLEDSDDENLPLQISRQSPLPAPPPLRSLFDGTAPPPSPPPPPPFSPGEMSRITDALFLSGAVSVTPSRLRHNGITCVMNCTNDVPAMPSMPSVEFVRIGVDDTPTTRIAAHVDRAADKIRAVRDKRGRTLVHCAAGVSRSASVCIGYLMKHHCMTLKESYAHVKSIRPVIRPNPGFFRQLIKYERQLFEGTSSVAMVTSPIGFIPDVYQDEIANMVFIPMPAAPATGGEAGTAE